MNLTLILAGVGITLSCINAVFSLLLFLRYISFIKGIVSIVRVNRKGEVICE